MTYKNIKRIFESIMNQPEGNYTEIDGVNYPSHETYGVFRKILKEFKKNGGSINKFKREVIDGDYFKKAKSGVLLHLQLEFLYDVIDLLNDNCPYIESLDYED